LVRGGHHARHLRQLEGDRLVLANDFPERTAASRIPHSQLAGAVGDTAAARGHVYPTRLDVVRSRLAEAWFLLDQERGEVPVRLARALVGAGEQRGEAGRVLTYILVTCLIRAEMVFKCSKLL